MSVKIRLKRFGTKKRVYYRVVVVDSRAPRDGSISNENFTMLIWAHCTWVNIHIWVKLL